MHFNFQLLHVSFLSKNSGLWKCVLNYYPYVVQVAIGKDVKLNNCIGLQISPYSKVTHCVLKANSKQSPCMTMTFQNDSQHFYLEIH